MTHLKSAMFDDCVVIALEAFPAAAPKSRVHAVA